MAKTKEQSLKKLKRSELLEIMLAQSQEIDQLRTELAQKESQLQEKNAAMQQSGSIAEASLRLTNVFEEAQKAADLYLANVRGEQPQKYETNYSAPAPVQHVPQQLPQQPRPAYSPPPDSQVTAPLTPAQAHAREDVDRKRLFAIMGSMRR